MGVVGWVVGPQDFHVILWHFENGASVKIDDVLAEDGGLLHVLALAGQVGWTFLDHSYFLNFFVGPLLLVLMMLLLKMVNYSMSFLSLSTSIFFGRTSRGDHSGSFLFSELFCGTTPSCLKVRG